MQFRPRYLAIALLPLVSLPFLHGFNGDRQPQAVRTLPPPAPSIAGNQAPRFQGDSDAAELALVDRDFSHEARVSDPDADVLQFTASNLPPWAHIDATTGRITGRPGMSDIGTYESIAITVSDGQHQVSSRSLTITVTGPAAGVATLQWPAPVSKVDGSILDDLAGFRILYGRDPEDLDHSVWLADPAARSYSFATLEKGAWYFSIVAVNTAGLEGPPTMPARKII
jgi:hypothetical protein